MPSLDEKTAAGPPRHVEQFARASGVSVADVRWCHEPGCRSVAYAFDDFQRAALARAGFDDRCPDCQVPS